ncbi:hypothetical protein EJ03DRAFT_63710 [Teratosphaeria nubilosa]|uniref:F-box domain-containing protein n=1 Tax=Teratosphaeria nubilosa TaxID=161662 RepID=A0A6G1LCA2_9PEZI|nr:hypothetical protein EJ03DRAFT_63710 [Teratosphaeria nubilosa]
MADLPSSTSATMANLLVNTTVTEPDRLRLLPPELHVRIFDMIDYRDAIRLSQAGRFYKNLVRPRRWPHENKVAFIGKHQFHAKHNQWRMALFQSSPPGSPPGLICVSDGLACYQCYRVLPRGHFSIRQSTKSRAKGSPRETQPGFIRACVGCNWAKKAHRPGTMFKTIILQNISPAAFTRSGPRSALVRKGPWLWTLCEDCRGFVSIRCTSMRAMAIGYVNCTSCGQERRLRKGAKCRIVGKSVILDPCARCGVESTRLCGAESKRIHCCFCLDEVCARCAVATGEGSGWWCGADCSNAARDFVIGVVREGQRRLPATATAIATATLARREKCKRLLDEETDLFAMEDCGENALALLKL